MTDERPTIFETIGAGLFDLITREKSGEFIIESVEVGPRNAQYTVKVRYPTEQQAQLIP